MTPADEATVRAVELWPGAGALVTQGPSPARGTGAPGHLISIMMSLESSPAIHGVTARPVLTAAVLLTALAVSPVWTLLLALDREHHQTLYSERGHNIRCSGDTLTLPWPP